MNYAKAFFGGNLTAVPELKQTNSGMEYSQFSIAINRKYKEEEQVSFFSLTAWGNTAKALCSFTKKGQNLFFECEPRQETWKTEQGESRSKVVFSVIKFEFLGSKQEESQEVVYNDGATMPSQANQAPAQAPVKQNDFSASGEVVDDVPFMRLNEWGGM